MSEPRDEGHAKGYRGTTGRNSSSYRNPSEKDRLQRSTQTRQILSGAELRSPVRGASSYPVSNSVLTQPQLMYAAALAILLALSVLIWLIFGLGVASILFFLLALGLLGGWLAF